MVRAGEIAGRINYVQNLDGIIDNNIHDSKRGIFCTALR